MRLGLGFRAASILAGLAATPVCASDDAGAAPLRIVAFGTSLTARGGWQEPLRAALQRCLGKPVEVDTVALSGSTSEWARGQVSSVSRLRPDIVLVEFSANDAALNRWMSVSGSRENMVAVFDGLREALPDAKIYSMAMNPIIGLRGWIRPYLSDYIDAHRALAEERGFGFIDFRPAWSSLSTEALAAAIPDGSHPRPEIAGTIIVPELVRQLAGSCDERVGPSAPVEAPVHDPQGGLTP